MGSRTGKEGEGLAAGGLRSGPGLLTVQARDDGNGRLAGRPLPLQQSRPLQSYEVVKIM